MFKKLLNTGGERDRRKQESQELLILWMGIIKDAFVMEGKECKVQERLKM